MNSDLSLPWEGSRKQYDEHANDVIYYDEQNDSNTFRHEWAKKGRKC